MITRRSLFSGAAALLCTGLAVDDFRLRGQVSDLDNSNKKLDNSKKKYERDYDAAIHQFHNTYPDKTSIDQTVSFSDCADKYSWLQQTARNGVGKVKTGNDFGSGVILAAGDYGLTIALCSHQFIADTTGATITFFLDTDTHLQLPLSDLRPCKSKDLMFATVHLDSIPDRNKNASKLFPVPANHDFSSKATPASEQVLVIGFPAPCLILSATEGPIIGYDDECLFRAQSVSFEANSGGAVINSQGKLTGILSMSSPPGAKASSFFIPIDFVMAAFQEVYPERAIEAGFPVVSREKLHDDCHVSRRDFSFPETGPR